MEDGRRKTEDRGLFHETHPRENYACGKNYPCPSVPIRGWTASSSRAERTEPRINTDENTICQAAPPSKAGKQKAEIAEGAEGRGERRGESGWGAEMAE